LLKVKAGLYRAGLEAQADALLQAQTSKKSVPLFPALASPTGRTLLWKIKALEIEWDSFCFAVSHAFSK